MSFVSFSEKFGTTELTIDATEVPPGVYTLYIESFDANSNIQSALKTDSIEVTVETLQLQFASELTDEEITAGAVSYTHLTLPTICSV